MKFKGWSGEQMYLALARLTEKTETVFRFTGGVPLDVKVGSWNTRIVPDGAFGIRTKGDDLYPAGVLVRPTSSGKGTGRRRVHAACYHAHGHFMRALFEINPDGRIFTAKASYLGARSFDERAGPVGWANVGSRSNPSQYRELCDCHEHGLTRF